MVPPIIINDRLYTEILQWCDINGIEPMVYIERALRQRLATDKYGDLNEKVRKSGSISLEQEKEVTVVVDTVQKIDDNPIKTAPETSEASGGVVLQNEKEKPVKRTRTLKSK